MEDETSATGGCSAVTLRAMQHQRQRALVAMRRQRRQRTEFDETGPARDLTEAHGNIFSGGIGSALRPARDKKLRAASQTKEMNRDAWSAFRGSQFDRNEDSGTEAAARLTGLNRLFQQARHIGLAAGRLPLRQAAPCAASFGARCGLCSRLGPPVAQAWPCIAGQIESPWRRRPRRRTVASDATGSSAGVSSRSSSVKPRSSPASSSAADQLVAASIEIKLGRRRRPCSRIERVVRLSWSARQFAKLAASTLVR